MLCTNNPKIDCTCKNTDCENWGKCCACVANHRKIGTHPPMCFTPPKKD